MWEAAPDCATPADRVYHVERIVIVVICLTTSPIQFVYILRCERTCSSRTDLRYPLEGHAHAFAQKPENINIDIYIQHYTASVVKSERT